MSTLTLSTARGRTFTFDQYNIDDDWYTGIGGLYFFAKFIPERNSWRVLYIGKTNCFRTRMNVHAKSLWLRALKLGASAVFAVKIDSEADRVWIEADLIGQYNPVLNIQNNPLNHR
jgi:excinuclease UvrABC nuclease subunit